MLRRLAALAATILTLAGCTTSSGSETRFLVDELDDVSPEVNGAVAQLFDVLAQPYDNRSQLYQRLNDLRLPNTFAVQLDKAQRIDPPPGSEAELDRYLSFLGDLLLTSEQLDLAIATEDPEATAIAAVSIEVAVGALAVVLPAESCSALVPERGRDLCDPGGLEGFEAALSYELRRFGARFRPAFRVPETFGDVIRGRVLATLQSDAARVLDEAAARIEALDPGTTYPRLQAILIEYFPEAIAGWAQHQADATGSDPLIYDFIVDSLEAVRLATHDRLQAEYSLIVSAIPTSQIIEVVDIWFGVEPSEPAE